MPLFVHPTHTQSYLWLAVCAFVLSPVASLATSPQPVPCTGGSRGPGSSQQQKCLAGHIPGFGGYDQSGCTMTVYLADRNQEQQARKILEPFSKAMLSHCGANRKLEIRQGKYQYLDLYHWATMASHLLKFNQATQVPGVGGMPLAPFPNNRIPLSVDNDATISQVKNVLRQHKIPVDAFVIRSRETYARELASISIAPTVRHRGGRETVWVPAILWGGKRDGSLMLGDSTLAETRKMLPAFPGHGPRKPVTKIGSRVNKEIREVLRRITREYNPAGTQTLVGFDGNQRLIFVHFLVEPAQARRFAKELDRIGSMHEAYRDSTTVIRRGSLTPCVLAETTARVQQGGSAQVKSAAYFYTCATRQ